MAVIALWVAVVPIWGCIRRLFKENAAGFITVVPPPEEEVAAAVVSVITIVPVA